MRMKGAMRTIKFALGENPMRVHGEGRGVGCQDAIIRYNGFQFSEYILFYVQVFNDGFDDQVAI